MSARTALLAATLAAPLALAGLPARADLKLPRPSPGATVTQTIGVTDLTVKFSRPGVKNRVIWGDLVPYDKPWRTGANEATTLTTTGEIMVGGQKLAPGTYSLFTIPGKDTWSLVLNSEQNLWGAYEYKPEKDVLKVTLQPSAAAPQEWMNFSFEDLTDQSANLVLRWEKLRVAVPITVDVNARVLADCRAAVDSAKAGDWRTPYQAAGFCFNSNVAPEDGTRWLNKSLAVEKNYYNQRLLARWQMKDGKKSDAIATAQKAIAAGKASKETVDTSEMEKQLAEWTATGKKS